MWKKTISLVLMCALLLGVSCFGTAAALQGDISEDLSWFFVELDGLRITGTGDAIPDYAPGEAPWHKVAGNIYRLYLPSTLKRIGNNAFSGCANLKSVDLPEHLSGLGAGAFRDCGIESIVLPYSLKQIEADCFRGCDELKSITFKTISSGAMGDMKYEGVEQIGAGAFAFCYNLERIQFPQTLVRIEQEAFTDCYCLKSVSFENGGKNVTEIGQEAFCDCVALTSLELPETLTTIEAGTFRGTGFKAVKLHASIKSVGEGAYAYCSALARIDVYNTDCVFYESASTTPDAATLYVEGKAQQILSYAQAFQKPVKVLCAGRNTSHPKYVKTVTKANDKKDGQIKQVCPSCGHTVITRIAKVQSVKLTKTAFTRNAKVQYPSVSQVEIVDADGNTIAPGEYTVKNITAAKEVGKHAVKITFKSGSNYYGSFTRYYKINPKGTDVRTVSAGKGSLKVTWKKQTTKTDGYQIRICKKSNFSSGVKTYTVKNNKTITKTLKSLSKKTTYYIQVRTYKKVSGTPYYSGWSTSFVRKTK